MIFALLHGTETDFFSSRYCHTNRFCGMVKLLIIQICRRTIATGYIFKKFMRSTYMHSGVCSKLPVQSSSSLSLFCLLQDVLNNSQGLKLFDSRALQKSEAWVTSLNALLILLISSSVTVRANGGVAQYSSLIPLTKHLLLVLLTSAFLNSRWSSFTALSKVLSFQKVHSTSGEAECMWAQWE